MKRALILAIILLIMFMPTKSTPTVLDFSAEDLDAYGIAGAMMMVAPIGADDLVPIPKPEPPKPVTECKCKNGKVSYDGGTSLTDCPCKDSDKDCGCKKSVKEILPDTFPRIVLITQPSVCPPCVTTDKNVVAKLRDDIHKKAGWDVGPEAFNDLQVLDLDDEASYDEIDRLKLKYTSIPSFFYLEKSGVTKIYTGAISYDTYIKWSKKN
jgi:hypothetical protein